MTDPEGLEEGGNTMMGGGLSAPPPTTDVEGKVVKALDGLPMAFSPMMALAKGEKLVACEGVLKVLVVLLEAELVLNWNIWCNLR